MKNNNDLVIETHGLSKAYKNVQALKSLDLKVAQHSIFGFLGPNGAGKTTLYGANILSITRNRN
jgi:ABC-2 type transport system ATP-binding protein